MMRIDLTCPVEAWKVTLPDPEHPQCDVTLFNLSSLQVVSVEVTIFLSSEDGEETARLIHRGRGLSGAPGRTFTMTVPVEGYVRAERYEITVDKVWYDNASVWRREKENMVEYEPNNLRRSTQLTALRSVAGEMASGYPRQQEGLWVCVCGRPNLDETTLCARCHREKAEVFARYNRQAVAEVIKAREQELADRGRETLIQTSRKFADEKDFVRRKGRHGWILRLVAAIVIIAALGYAGYTWGLPFAKYQLALHAYEAGEYARAETIFAEISDNPEAEKYVMLSRFNQAQELMVGDPSEAEVIKARQLLETIASYEEAHPEIADDMYSPYDLIDHGIPAWLERCDWLQAEILFSQGRYDEAEPFYAALGEEYVLINRLDEIAYIRANDLLDDGQWEEARAAFAALGDYQDSASLRLDTWLNQAVIAMDAGETDTALTLLQQIPGHRNADTLVKQIYYERGVALRAQGKINEAAEAFYLAKGYEDAEDQANECFYTPASIAYETLDFETAAALFAKIPDYRDAKEKWEKSTIEAARTAMKQINYKKARTLLETLPAENETAAALLLDCTYEPAMNAYIRGDYQEAIEGFSAIAGHKDSAEMIRKARIEWANDLYEAGNLTEAAELYAQANETGKLSAVRYDQAKALAAAGDVQSLDQAISLFTQLGEYGDAPALAQQAKAAKADALLASGDAAAARAIYAALEQTDVIAARLKECDYAIAASLAADGKAAEALAAFTALGNYADSADRVRQLQYEAALSLASTDPAAALTAFEALGDYADSAVQAKQLRYEAAEKLLATDEAAAIAAFEALGDYADAKSRIHALAYRDALALLETDRDAALDALDAIGEYPDAYQKACELRYQDAKALADAGEWEQAAAIFDAIAGYEDAASAANQLRYDAAIAFAEKGEWEQAAAAFSAMSGEVDADEKVNALRYEAAEDLLKAGAKEAAAAAFAAIGSYKDAQERANTLRYEAAEKLAETDWAAAAEAFEALGDYEDAKDRALSLRYNQAAKLDASGDWRAASDLYLALGDYSDSAEKSLQVRYQAAAKLAAAAKWDESVALYKELGSYADCAERVKLTRYQQAQAAEAAADYKEAARVYAALGNYKDSSAKVGEMNETYYGGPAAAMKKAHDTGDYATVIQIMSWLDTKGMPKKYEYIFPYYEKACYQEGLRLLNAGKPYDALVYFHNLPDNYPGLSEKLQRPCYLILGTWEDLQGNRYIFREEGVCNLGGEVLVFNVNGTDMSTGATAAEMAVTHRLTGVNRTNAWLYDLRGGTEVTIYLTRVKN